MSVSNRNNLSPVDRGERIPWALMGAALMAMLALYFTSDRVIAVPVIAALMVLSQTTAWRLPRTFLIGYGLRGVILVAAIMRINQTDVQDVTPWYLKQHATNIAGYALALDLALRAWQKRERVGAREGLGVFALLTGFVFTMATNTYERWHIQLIAPAYALFLLLAFRGFSLMQQPESIKPTRRSGLIGLRALAMMTTLALAGGSVYAITRYEYQVENYAMQFLQKSRNAQHEIGFSASAKLGRVFDPVPSVARVLVIEGKLTDPHLGAAAFDTCQDSQWLPSVGDRSYTALSLQASVLPAKAELLQFTRLADTADLIPHPLQVMQITSADTFEADRSGTVHDTHSGSMEPYQVTASASPILQSQLTKTPVGEERARLLAIPQNIDRRVVALAQKVAGSGDAPKQIARLQEYLRAHHAYSLSFDPQGDPLSDFILNDRAAHCQYFASAMVMMARAAGIPARYVGGFYAHEPYGTDQIVVRQRDAHAWCECWLAGIGWVTVDATPSSGVPDKLFQDPPAWKRWWEKLGDLPGEVRQWLHDNRVRILWAFAMGAAIWSVVWVVRRIMQWRSRAGLVPAGYGSSDEQLRELARRYERWLRSRGTPCPPNLTWRAHVFSSNKNAPALAERCSLFVAEYDRARFGLDGESVARAKEVLSELEREKGDGY